MNANEWVKNACEQIQPDTDLVRRHLDVLTQMVKIDSRSFNVNEFEGDRKTPTDMQEILHCAEQYLKGIGFTHIRINEAPADPPGSTPILMAGIPAAADKPTLLFYAHLDKQPYMDDGTFAQWGGIPPTELTWNESHTRAYGRGAADDLSGVVSIGIAVEAMLGALGLKPGDLSPQHNDALPCNIKVIYETEEECGSHSLIQQIQENKDFFSGTDCVVITDVVNPATGMPGLTTSLRGIVQIEASLRAQDSQPAGIDAQTALYKLMATLIREDHSIAVEAIRNADIPETPEETRGYAGVPTSVEQLKETAGLLPGVRSTVPETVEAVLLAQLRKSFVNVRPGNRISGSIIFAAAGARLHFSPCQDPSGLQQALANTFEAWNRFSLKLNLEIAACGPDGTAVDCVLRASSKSPHSGINGGPFPVAELQLAALIDKLVAEDGSLPPHIARFFDASAPARVRTEPLFVSNGGDAQTYENPEAKMIVEIRLAPGNRDRDAAAHLQAHLQEKTPRGFELILRSDKGASPWMTAITHPVFPEVMASLEAGFGHQACLYGCGGSIPFVAKLLDALGEVQPLCLGAYDPEARMHEPGESLSMTDLLGCARSMVHLMARAPQAYSAG